MPAAAATERDEIECTGAPAPFDPAAALFVAQHAHPHGLASVDLHALSPFQRGLLVIDGTVTSFIEAYALEPIDVLRLGQEEAVFTATEPWLELSAGAPVIRRRVMLRGRRTGRFFVWADSLIAVARIAPAMHDALQTDGGGLGRILAGARAETRRECLWYGREQRSDTPAEVAGLWRGDFLTRAYRVFAGGHPIMLVTERFPL